MIFSKKLLAVSYLAPNWFDYYQAVTNYLARTFNLDMRLIQGHVDPLTDPFLLSDEVDLAFICACHSSNIIRLLPINYSLWLFQ